MKFVSLALLAACLALSSPAFADDGKQEAEKLLAVLDVQATMD